MRFDILALARAQAERFWSKVQKDAFVPLHRRDLGPCWLWRAGVDKDGYGKFQLTTSGAPKQVHIRAHRMAWILSRGEVPPSDLVTIHECDTPSCVNPAHLRVGTQAENRADCGAKGRNAVGDASGPRKHRERLPRGSRHHRATISEATAIDIKARLARGERRAEIARVHAVSADVVQLIAANRTWRHV